MTTMKSHSALAALLLALLLCLGQLAAAGSVPQRQRRPSTKWTQPKPTTASLEGSTYTTANCQSSGGGCGGYAAAGVYGTATARNSLASLSIDSLTTVGIDPSGRKLQQVDTSFSGALAFSANGKEYTRTFGKPNDNTYAETAPGSGAVTSLSLSGSVAVKNPVTKDTWGRSWSVSRTRGTKDATAGALTSAGSEASQGGLKLGTYASTGGFGGVIFRSSSFARGGTKNRKMLMA